MEKINEKDLLRILFEGTMQNDNLTSVRSNSLH